MRDIVVNFIIGFIFGVILTVGLIASDTRIRADQQTEIKENVSMRPPAELPKDIEFDEINIDFKPLNRSTLKPLNEVIL